MLWVATIVTLIPWIVCQSNSDDGVVQHDVNTGSLTVALNRISELEERYVNIEKQRETDQIRMNALEKQRLIDQDRIALLEKYYYTDRQHISDLSKHQFSYQHHIDNLEKQIQDDNKHIADLEKEREAENIRMTDFEQQLRVLQPNNQSESKNRGTKFDVVIETDLFKSTDKSDAKQQQHDNILSKTKRRRDNPQLSFHRKANEHIFQKEKRVANDGENIAFHAFLTHSYPTPNKLMELHFDRIITNLDSAYNNDTGTFTCPKAGVYVFHWTVHISGGWLSTEVVRNGIQVGTAFSGVTLAGKHTSGGGMTAVQLNEGDRVWVRLPGESYGAAILPNDTRFTGFLLK